MRKLLLAATAMSGLTVSAANANTFGNTYGGNIGYFGIPDTTSYGETFTAPAANSMTGRFIS